MNAEHDDGLVIWQRQVDVAKAQVRWETFAKFYGIPLVAALVLALILGGPGAMLGVLILLGSIGGMIALIIGLYNKGLAANPEIRLAGGRLVFGRLDVAIRAIETWTTQKHQNTDTVGHSYAASARFRIPVMRNGERGVRPDGGPAFDVVVFGWPEMTVQELTEVRLALEPHIPCPWQPPDQLRA